MYLLQNSITYARSAKKLAKAPRILGTSSEEDSDQNGFTRASRFTP